MEARILLCRYLRSWHQPTAKSSGGRALRCEEQRAQVPDGPGAGPRNRSESTDFPGETPIRTGEYGVYGPNPGPHQPQHERPIGITGQVDRAEPRLGRNVSAIRAG